VRVEDRAGADPRPVGDDGKGADRGAFPDRRGWRDDRKAVNAGGRTPAVGKDLDRLGK
jgi:hypothetical protein